MAGGGRARVARPARLRRRSLARHPAHRDRLRVRLPLRARGRARPGVRRSRPLRVRGGSLRRSPRPAVRPPRPTDATTGSRPLSAARPDGDGRTPRRPRREDPRTRRGRDPLRGTMARLRGGAHRLLPERRRRDAPPADPRGRPSDPRRRSMRRPDLGFELEAAAARPGDLARGAPGDGSLPPSARHGPRLRVGRVGVRAPGVRRRRSRLPDRTRAHQPRAWAGDRRRRGLSARSHRGSGRAPVPRGSGARVPDGARRRGVRHRGHAGNGGPPQPSRGRHPSARAPRGWHRGAWPSGGSSSCRSSPANREDRRVREDSPRNPSEARARGVVR